MIFLNSAIPSHPSHPCKLLGIAFSSLYTWNVLSYPWEGTQRGKLANFFLSDICLN